MRKKIILICPQCLSRNYTTYVSNSCTGSRFEIKKYCPKCGEYTLHKESK